MIIRPMAKMLSEVQRLACRCFIGAMTSTPIWALEVIVNLPPHIFIQRTARSSAYRLVYKQAPIRKSHGVKHQKVVNELKEALFERAKKCHGSEVDNRF